MFKNFLVAFAILALFITPAAYSQDWGVDYYDTYDYGFYDTTTSDLYDADDDWFYDGYIEGKAQAEEDIGLLDQDYGWEADDDLFADDI